ncbi:hypothetical protein, variant 1 [Aphanomyces invadans]|uniref:EGF-like domain-containing protein n=1 Tax=Aphanomyces invadans TaxID=157072 RepID=A0A024URG4_9STRA|nr:hypothetical protein, variant 1 [Aphanomyces invadans]ETW08218.1 hypothetical protein, variant 1 [Aphanomyces invadans]|eukprot:XP_008862023.1 hypothetical protein, variant 1 [Aphanomyces invadans]
MRHTLLVAACGIATSMRVHRAWTTQPWCDSVVSPVWPFAYQKDSAQTVEFAGRVNTNTQDMRHECSTYGVQSKCHMCQDNSFQIQGVDWAALPVNIPTVTDSPFVVSIDVPTHRYDYGHPNISHVCVLLTGADCITPHAASYASCTTRCWGYHAGPLGRQADVDNATDVWSCSSQPSKAQGQVSTVAGSGQHGFQDGPVATAKFSSPRGVAVDSQMNVYVADTSNHRIRMVRRASQDVITIAGDGERGTRDGAVGSARFSFPTGIAVLESNGAVVKIFVADTGNHRIREINLQTQRVSCLGGRCGNGTETATLAQAVAPPQPGLADGSPNNSTFDSPMGIAVTPQGVVFVADTGNHVIRRIGLDGMTTTLAGNVVPQPNPIFGCAPPCVLGVRGFRDGNLTFAQFSNPTDVTLGPPNTLFVADDHRVRRVIYDTATVQGVPSSDRVVTVAGAGPFVAGETDGKANEASFHVTGVAMASDERLFTTSSISSHIRTVTPSALAVERIACTTRLFEVLSPSGCGSYDPPLGALDQKVSPAMANIYYNAVRRNESTPEGGKTVLGRKVQSCMGSPPIDALVTGVKSVPKYDSTGQPIQFVRQDVDAGTTIAVECPALCNSPTAQVFGTTMYSDASMICYAAIHAGLMTAAQSALLTLTLEPNTLYDSSAIRVGSVANGITSTTIPNEQRAARMFSLAITPRTQRFVQTIAGAPVSLLESPRGFRDAAPPLLAKFQGPTGIDVYGSPSRTNLVYIADTSNHRIRGLTAVCSKICENGGQCVSAETCACATGWRGDDCTTPVCTAGLCTGRQLCVAPNTCACIPGYKGFPACDVPICVQTCVHGRCGFPDTCVCASGWFDANCTTPVCSQTCGNFGNCTGPNTCTCTREWQGPDCRTPVCQQTCVNGGVCSAPNTCLCPAGWSGHDCAIPICTQGKFVAHPSGYEYGLFRPFSWDEFAPCEFDKWCQSTVGFDCAHRPSVLLEPQCSLIELRPTALSAYSYAVELADRTRFMRYSAATPYGQNRANLTYPGAPVLVAGPYNTPPYVATVDRILAHVERRRVTQGVYVCANQGNCTAPDICVCAQGWSGFDCRTPICTQGYYTPTQPTFVSAEPVESKHANHPTSNGNPVYPHTVETLFWDHYTVETVPQGNARFLSEGSVAQGGYACSSRSLTQFEKPATVESPAFYWDFANYFSHYMNDTMYWPPLYTKSPPIWDDTQDGYRRAGTWSYKAPTQWQKGTCLVQFARTCPSSASPIVSVDPDATFRPIVQYSAVNATRVLSYEGCVDTVRRGCFNNGTCVAPDECVCAAGWTGYDCSIPICESRCIHGVCTLPNRCTCDLGWTGDVCSVAICAQDCRNGGRCVAPDTCECTTWPSVWRDGRHNGGTPIFHLPDGSPQLTGWTGYDCNTPICTQAKRFVLNSIRDTPSFVAMRGALHKLPCVHLRCPQYDIEVTSNDGTSFQSGCAPGIPFPNPVFAGTLAEKQSNWDAYNDTATTGRQSASALCRVLQWRQGEFSHRLVRTNHPGADPGEGVCADGYTGFDCQIPLCRYTTPTGDVTGCQHNGICVSKDTCECIQTKSVLHQKYPLAPRGNTGWAGSSCSMAICVQGFYDAQCYGQARVGHEGCYRCANGGMCVAPDLCQCADGWTGYDCTEPVCKVKVTPEIRAQLFTVDENKVVAFENDPCGTQGGRWGKEVYNGAEMGQGNCTLPYLCTCLCRVRYDVDECKKTGEFCLKPWSDVFGRAIPAGFIFGTKHCSSGFQGLEDNQGRFQSCHLQIYEPTEFQRYTASFVAFMTIACILFMVSFYCIRRNIKRRKLLLKAERRRSRRESEENPLNPEFAFGHAQ